MESRVVPVHGGLYSARATRKPMAIAVMWRRVSRPLASRLLPEGNSYFFGVFFDGNAPLRVRSGTQPARVVSGTHLPPDFLATKP